MASPPPSFLSAPLIPLPPSLPSFLSPPHSSHGPLVNLTCALAPELRTVADETQADLNGSNVRGFWESEADLNVRVQL